VPRGDAQPGGSYRRAPQIILNGTICFEFNGLNYPAVGAGRRRRFFRDSQLKNVYGPIHRRRLPSPLRSFAT
jgi:hypothetical protein